MKEIKKVLFPVDLSEASAEIAPWVKTIAEKFNSEIHVLYVARAFGHYAGVGVPYTFVADFERELFKGAETSLADFMESTFKGLGAKATVVAGYPAEEILVYAEREGIDLIIIGTHGRRGLNRVIFGSVAEMVVKNAPVPVFTVNPYQKESTPQ